jgi:hypothetical protein
MSEESYEAFIFAEVMLLEVKSDCVSMEVIQNRDFQLLRAAFEGFLEDTIIKTTSQQHNTSLRWIFCDDFYHSHSLSLTLSLPSATTYNRRVCFCCVYLLKPLLDS